MNVKYPLLILITLCSTLTYAGVVAVANNLALVKGWNLVGNSVEAPITVATSFNNSN